MPNATTRPPDHWAALGLKPGASSDEIKVAYRQISRQCHPDAAGGPNPALVEMFGRARAAYETLSDPGKRTLWEADWRQWERLQGSSGAVPTSHTEVPVEESAAAPTAPEAKGHIVGWIVAAIVAAMVAPALFGGLTGNGSDGVISLILCGFAAYIGRNWLKSHSIAVVLLVAWAVICMAAGQVSVLRGYTSDLTAVSAVACVCAFLLGHKTAD